MKRRPSREISVFNLSMLDVICSALGAILVLYLISVQATSSHKKRAEKAESLVQTLVARMKEAMEALEEAQRQARTARAQADEADRRAREAQAAADSATADAAAARARARAAQAAADEARAAAAEAQQQADAARQAAGESIGMCHTEADTVVVDVWDHEAEDGDRVDLRHGATELASNLKLRVLPNVARFTLNLPQGVSYFVAQALNEGDGSPNTASVRVSPCNGTSAETFVWNMSTGEKRNVSIVRR
ncbi:MAG: hypothetical protein AMXMBFR64_25200 [Myxococcales bacterium]